MGSFNYLSYFISESTIRSPPVKGFRWSCTRHEYAHAQLEFSSHLSPISPAGKALASLGRIALEHC